LDLIFLSDHKKVFTEIRTFLIGVLRFVFDAADLTLANASKLKYKNKNDGT